MFTSLPWLCVVLGVLSAAITWLLIRLVVRHLSGYFPAHSNNRSAHNGVANRGGGIAIILTVILCLVALSFQFSTSQLVALAAVLLTGLVGLTEDVAPWPDFRVSLRLAAQFMLSAVIVAALVGMSWLLPLAIVFGAALVNSVNFMDGVNGMAAGFAVIVGVYSGVIGFIYQVPTVALVGVVMAGAYAGYLPFNTREHRVFMGDGGSYLLGALTWFLTIEVYHATDSWILALAPLGIFFTDTGFTLLRRLIQGKPVFQAHCEHIYQQIFHRNKSHFESAAVTLGFTVLSVFALVFSRNHLGIAIVAQLVLSVIYVSSPLMIRGSHRAVS